MKTIKERAKKLYMQFDLSTTTGYQRLALLEVKSFLMELANAPEPEPVAYLYRDNYRDLVVADSFQFGEFPVYAAPPAPSLPDGMILVRVNDLQKIAAHAKIAASNIVDYAKAGHTMYGWLDDSCTHADIAAQMANDLLAAAPTPQSNAKN